MALKNAVKNELWAISGASAMVLYHPIRWLLIVGCIFSQSLARGSVAASEPRLPVRIARHRS